MSARPEIREATGVITQAGSLLIQGNSYAMIQAVNGFRDPRLLANGAVAACVAAVRWASDLSGRSVAEEWQDFCLAMAEALER